MKNVKEVFAKNLVALRKSRNLTQSDLAQKLNYSDKAVSKWERGESVPDIEIIYQLSRFYGVTVDAMLEEDDILKKKGVSKKVERLIITLLSVLVVWLVAVIVFVILTWLVKNESLKIWLSFIYAIPTSAIVCIVFNSIWGKRYINPIISSVLIWTLVMSIFFTTTFKNNSFIFFVAIPLQVACILWFFLEVTHFNYRNLFRKKDKKALEGKSNDEAKTN